MANVGDAFQAYLHEQTKTIAAEADYNRAAAVLSLTRIGCRLAEIKSQAEPMNSMGVDREKAYAIAFYVVYGRMP